MHHCIAVTFFINDQVLQPGIDTAELCGMIDIFRHMARMQTADYVVHHAVALLRLMTPVFSNTARDHAQLELTGVARNTSTNQYV